MQLAARRLVVDRMRLVTLHAELGVQQRADLPSTHHVLPVRLAHHRAGGGRAVRHVLQLVGERGSSAVVRKHFGADEHSVALDKGPGVEGPGEMVDVRPRVDAGVAEVSVHHRFHRLPQHGRKPPAGAARRVDAALKFDRNRCGGLALCPSARSEQIRNDAISDRRMER